MTSPARAAANAANAQLSSGPTTEAGKARSSRNAVKHGLTSKELVIAPGEEQEFTELHDALLDQLAPEGALEMGLFNMIVHAQWQLQRFRALEAQLTANGVDSLLDESTAKALDRLHRYAAANQRSYFKALKELSVIQNNRIVRIATATPGDDQLPELVSITQVTKQTQDIHARVERAQCAAMEAYINAPLPRRLQNEAILDSTIRAKEVA